MSRNLLKLGMDKWISELSISQIINASKHHDLELYQLKMQSEQIVFYAHVHQRFKIKKILPQTKIIKTTGIFGFLISNFKNPVRVCSLFVFVIIFTVLSQCVFSISIEGENARSRVFIEKSLAQLKINLPILKTETKSLKSQLYPLIRDKIAWFEIYQKGSQLVIRFAPREHANITHLKRKELVAQEDGMIAFYDLQHGNKIREINELVNKGDVLVSNVVVDSQNIDNDVYVKGRVFAFVWKDVFIRKTKSRDLKSFAFFEMLLKARDEVSQSLREDDKIISENILQFEEDMGTIKMKLHYKILKDISTPS